MQEHVFYTFKRVISVKQILYGTRNYLRYLRFSNLSADACSSWGAKCTGHREGGGGDPVEEESSLPALSNLRARHRFSFNPPLEGGRLNCSCWFHPIQGDSSPLPP